MRTPYVQLNAVVCGLLVAFVAAPAFAETWTEWRNSLRPKGEPGPELTLVVEGSTEYAIVIPEDPTTQEQKAADDLAHWLKEMTGAEFPVASDGKAQSDRVVSVGKTTLLQAAGLRIAKTDLGNEGYAIGVQGEALYLVGGKKRGPINAVYALLEEDLGCRWYAGGTSHIPKRPSLKFSPVPRTSVPALEIRDPFYKVAFDGTWSLRNRTNAPSAEIPEEWGGHMNYALFVHTFNTLLPPSEYFDEHPEYFMMDGSGNRITRQLCTTNPDVVRIVTDSVLRILKEHPDAEIISVSKNDGGATCQCPKCKALDEAEGSDAASLLFLVNKVAGEVEKHYPDAIVSTLAYLETVNPPKTVRPRSNVAIRLCTDNCMWSHPFTPAREIEAFNKALVGWGAIHKRIHIWDYCVNFSHYTAPMPNLDVIADNIRFFLAYNAKGVMEQGAYQSPGAERDLLRAWVLAKFMWDPTRNIDDLTQDFIWGYFGKAAPAVAAYDELLKEAASEHAESMKAPEGGIRYRMDAPFLSKEFLRKAVDLYDQAEALADDEETLHRVQCDRLPIMYVQLCRGPEFVQELFGETRYAQLVDKFEATARRVGLTHIYEGPPDFEQKLKAWRDAM